MVVERVEVWIEYSLDMSSCQVLDSDDVLFFARKKS